MFIPRTASTIPGAVLKELREPLQSMPVCGASTIAALPSSSSVLHSPGRYGVRFVREPA